MADIEQGNTARNGVTEGGSLPRSDILRRLRERATPTFVALSDGTIINVHELRAAYPIYDGPTTEHPLKGGRIALGQDQTITIYGARWVEFQTLFSALIARAEETSDAE